MSSGLFLITSLAKSVKIYLKSLGIIYIFYIKMEKIKNPEYISGKASSDDQESQESLIVNT
jgi:hypothetical protein